MTEPKYTIGDEVWRMAADKVTVSIITGMFADGKKFFYSLKKERPTSSWDWVKEHDLFITKKDLIDSL